MARPKEFDRDAKLNAALKLFWERGFAGTSTSMLLRRMRISRQSMYDTYGDKRQLYLEALEAYASKRVSTAIQHLMEPSSPLAGIEAMMMSYVNLPESEQRLGCMGVSAVCEFGQSDAEVTNALSPHGLKLTAMIQSRLEQAKASGEVAGSLDPVTGAIFIASTLNNIRVVAKSGAPLTVLEAIARFALNGIKL